MRARGIKAQMTIIVDIIDTMLQWVIRVRQPLNEDSQAAQHLQGLETGDAEL